MTDEEKILKNTLDTLRRTATFAVDAIDRVLLRCHELPVNDRNTLHAVRTHLIAAIDPEGYMAALDQIDPGRIASEIDRAALASESAEGGGDE